MPYISIRNDRALNTLLQSTPSKIRLPRRGSGSWASGDLKGIDMRSGLTQQLSNVAASCEICCCKFWPVLSMLNYRWRQYYVSLLTSEVFFSARRCVIPSGRLYPCVCVRHSSTLSPPPLDQENLFCDFAPQMGSVDHASQVSVAAHALRSRSSQSRIGAPFVP